jgi:spermidine synthase
VTVRLLVLGALALLGQVVLLRECEVASYGSELVLVLGLGAWLAGTAAGALTSRRARAAGERAIRVALLGLGAAIPLGVVLARGSRRLFGGVTGADLPFGLQLATLGLCLLPAAFLVGLLFPWMARHHTGSGRGSAARAYALESAGGLVGGILSTALPALGVQNWAMALLCGGAACAAARPGPRRGRRREAWVRVPAAAGALAALALLAFSPALDRAMTRWSHPDLRASRDTPYGRVTVAGTLGQVAVFESDALAYESQGTAAEEFVQLAAAQRETVRRVLVLGGATQGLVPQALRLGRVTVDDVELDRGLLALALPYLPAAERGALADSRVRLVFADPRRFLARPGRYDLILSGMPEPQSGRTNRFYTREFFAACAARLEPNGVLALRLRGAENLWTPALTRRTAAVHRALRGVFPATVVLPGATNLLLASRAALPLDPAVPGARLAARLPGARIATPAYARYLYTNDRFAETARRLERDPARANRDARPACYQATMVLWLSRYFPRLAMLDLPDVSAADLARAPAGWAAVVVLLAGFALARRRGVLRRALYAAVAGFAGMLIESVLLLHYQTRAGVLYQDLGLLLTAFMGGLALGAWGLERLSGARGPRPGAAWMVPAALAALATATALLVGPGGAPYGAGGLPVVALLLAATGAVVAAAYAVAVLRGAPDPGAVTGPVYAADLAGGCLGSLVAGLAAIPLLGLPATVALAAAAALTALVVA